MVGEIGRRCWMLVAGMLLVLASAAAPPAARAATPSCQLAPPSGPARPVPRLASPEALALLGVLGRPAAPGDRPPDLRDVDARAIDAEGARLIGSGPGGARYYLVPVVERPPRFDARCKRRLSRRDRRELERFERAARPQGPTLLLHEVRPDGGSTRSVDLAAVRENDLWGGCSGRGCERPYRSRIFSVVPDGVAAVRLRFRGGLEREVPVASNFWVTEVPIKFDRALPAATQWIGPDGQVVREFRDAGV